MQFWELVLIGISLSMDAFAVALCQGLSMPRVKWGRALLVAGFFGGFQALMPLIGYFLGSSLKSLIESYDHWIAFVLLALIGANMIREAFSEEETQNDSFSFRTMFMMAIATSIDALAAGIAFAVLSTSITRPVIIIGLVTAALSMLGVMIGSRFGQKFRSKAQVAGGAVLCLIGIKILLDHLNV